MMLKIALVVLLFSLMACSSREKKSASLPVSSPAEVRPTLVQEKKAEAAATATPALKGPFLNYIYRIQPDHIQPGYSITTDQLGQGYASGAGPYDGAFFEFFLFRGAGRDIVIKQTTGYEVSIKETKYGSKLEPYAFAKGKMRKLRLSQVFPINAIEKIFESQILKLAAKPEYQNWEFHRLIVLPKVGTKAPMLVCELLPEPPFATETNCLQVGELNWNKKKFQARSVNEIIATKAVI